MKTKKVLWSLSVAVICGTCALQGAEKLKALIIDGQNNHDWRKCTPVLKWILEDSGRFTVDVTTTPPGLPRPKQATPEQRAELEKANAEKWQQWRPVFKDYDLLVGNYTGDRWPDPVRADFEAYVRNGGGLVIVHAADNAFPDWPEYNEMIAVGGWGGRNEKSGPMVRWRDGKVVLDHSPGPGGTHGPQHEFVVETRQPDHPIMKGLPTRWLHATDELYSKMRGPAKNLTVLATAYAAPEKKGTGEHEPILMTIDYGKGRVFHTVLGHGPGAMSGMGFQVTLQRGAEWAATSKVTLPPPDPEKLAADKVTLRPPPQ